MLGSEADQSKIDEEQKASKNRVIGGAVAAGVGVVGSIVGDSLINGKLGERSKSEERFRQNRKRCFGKIAKMLERWWCKKYKSIKVF